MKKEAAAAVKQIRSLEDAVDCVNYWYAL